MTVRFTPGLRMMPSLRTIVLGCVDPRVDPAAVLGAEPGQLAVIRNVGGRVTPGVRAELAMLRVVTQAAGGDLGPGWKLIVLHHTDCGITRLADRPEMLGAFFGVEPVRVAEMAVGDPWTSVALDAASLAADPGVPGLQVSGLVYDVATGLVDVVVEP
jgi:carbonic anhydrase